MAPRSSSADGPTLAHGSRRQFLHAGMLGIAACCLACLPTPARQNPSRARPARIGYLTLDPIGPGNGDRFRDGFISGLEAHGYRIDETLLLDVRHTHGVVEEQRAAVAELVATGIDVLMLPISLSVPIAVEVTDSVPIVTAVIGDPVALGLADSLARPTRNVTGLSILTAPLSGKRLEFLREMDPSIAKLGVLRNAGYPETEQDWAELTALAPALGIELVPLNVRSASDLDHAFQLARDSRVDSLLVVPDGLINARYRSILQFAQDARIPAVYPNEAFTRNGGLISYGPDRVYNFYRAAFYVDRLLKGTSPQQLPFEQPTRFDLIIHRGAATALGLQIPRQVLLSATEVID